MRKYYFTLLWACFGTTVLMAQNNLDTITINKKDTFEVVVQLVKSNTFYRGLDNPVKISVPANVDKVVIECSCEKFWGSNGNYIFKPGAEKSITLTISQIKKNKIIQTKEFKFPVKSVPTPKIMLCNRQSGDTINKGCFASYNIGNSDFTGYAPVLIPMMKDFEYDVYAMIEGFDLKFTKDGKVVEHIGNKGNLIPIRALDEIKELPSGTNLFFDNVKIRVPGGDVRVQSAYFIIN